VGKLVETLCGAEKRPQVIRDVCTLIDEEVSHKGGISGIAIKGGYAVVKGLKPGFVANAVDHMLDEFVEKLESFYEQYRTNGSGQSIESYFSSRSDNVAESLLGVTDARASKADSGALKKTYERLRPYAKKNVEQAVPGVGRLLDKHLK
jgi:hypothetical protein